MDTASPAVEPVPSPLRATNVDEDGMVVDDEGGSEGSLSHTVLDVRQRTRPSESAERASRDSDRSWQYLQARIDKARLGKSRKEERVE